nr:PLD nuclease N-terminal domain-containing protein [Nocardioides perillae]
MAIVVGPLVLALWIFCLVGVLTSRDDDVRLLPRWGWLLAVLLFPFVGSVVWLAFGRPVRDRPRRGERSQPAFPEYDRPGRMAASDPAADEAFLRRVRERAEEQRRRAAEQRRVEEQRRAEEQRGTEDDDPQTAAYPDGS